MDAIEIILTLMLLWAFVEPAGFGRWLGRIARAAARERGG